MAAYAALVSLMHIIDQIQNHPRPPIALDKNQVQSLTEKVSFLQEFLEVYSHFRNEEAVGLQSRIAEVAYEAEDVIESHIVDQILVQSTNHEEAVVSTPDFYLALQRVTQSMDLIKKEVMRVKEKMGSIQDIQLHRRSSLPTAGSSRSPLKVKNIVVGLDDVLNQLMDKLTAHQSNRQIISIVGMGGMGKTTLAKNAYVNPLIVQHFDIRAWATISHEYSVKNVLLELHQNNQDNSEILGKMSEEQLRETLRKNLWGRRYLIVLDDMWSVEAWEKINFLFPDNGNGSGIIITSRLSNLALHTYGGCCLKMNFLDEELSWNLLCQIVFGEDGCPPELEKIGRTIARNCEGLPLSIVVIGGLLAKSEQTKEYWKDIAENLNSIVNSEDNERCSKLLYTSYNYLPTHLKPCFLYMSVFPEDSVIHVSNLIKLWVAEGFLKPVVGKSLEEVAQEYLNDLIDRNLILALKWKYNGKTKLCKIHDLLRDLCLREAHKEKFLRVTKLHSLNEEIDTIRRIAIHGGILDSDGEYRPLEINDPSQYASLVRSLECEFPIDLTDFKLLRVLKVTAKDYPTNIFLQKVNLRYIETSLPSRFPSSIYRLWNLQTLRCRCHSESAIRLWKMPLLRHVKFCHFHLKPCNEIEFVLENLQTLSGLVNFRCSEKMVTMIPNIKRLKIIYYKKFEGSRYCLNNLEHLHKLESLHCDFRPLAAPSRSDILQNLTFPHSLKKLTLGGCHLHWEDISTKLGSLPLLQVLKLSGASATGPEWETIEGQFLSLKYLEIDKCKDLECWTTDNTHFPRLEHLVLRCLRKLKEIPLSVGGILTLQSIGVILCSNSAVISAKKIAEEQEQYGNENLLVRVTIEENPVLLGLASHNFQVEEVPTW